MNRRVLDKYVARNALTESVSAADAVGGAFSRAVVVPACGEAADFVAPLERAAVEAGGRTLLVLVVNARDAASPRVHELNEALLDVAEAHRHEALELVPVDRARPGRRMGEGEGVGTARRIGLDLAATLRQRGQVDSPWLFNTDGDAAVPADYFAAVDGIRRDAVAVVLPFVHTASGDAAVDRAHRLYEMSLRYYCLGLAHAGSSYVHHSMGSAMVFRADAYAAARGMPRREAAEDFYMLDKLAKLGPVAQPRCTALEIASRRSDRVPFGTGRAVSTIADDAAAGGEFRLYDPRCFEVLGLVQEAIADGDAEAIAAVVRHPDAGPALAAIGAARALEDAANRERQRDRRVRRMREWFDGFRTMRFVHELRDRRFPLLPWREAIARAPFVASTVDDSKVDPIVETSDLLCRLEWERLRA